MCFYFISFHFIYLFIYWSYIQLNGFYLILWFLAKNKTNKVNIDTVPLQQPPGLSYRKVNWVWETPPSCAAQSCDEMCLGCTEKSFWQVRKPLRHVWLCCWNDILETGMVCLRGAQPGPSKRNYESFIHPKPGRGILQLTLLQWLLMDVDSCIENQIRSW